MDSTHRTATGDLVGTLLYGGLRTLIGFALAAGVLSWAVLWAAVVRLHVLAGDFGAAALACVFLLAPAFAAYRWRREL